MKTLRQVLTDMRRGDVLEALDEGSRHDSGFDSGFGSQSLSINRSEGEVKRNNKGARHSDVSTLLNRMIHSCRIVWSEDWEKKNSDSRLVFASFRFVSLDKKLYSTFRYI